ncbi:unnamed protein product [Cylindrotheca closterium]|uniref:Uncharacterized protein n=1 Tax=Cylindrotheca closterium TaxID=2856 RepID=A0AAD2FJ93_9STRA|nr:unnamed protein product [Cylindrotheca closterium]
MKSNLLCVDQLQDFGIIVNDVPLQRLKRKDRNQYSHSLIDENLGLHIPMDFLKPISFFACRKPALSELDEKFSVEMTSSAPWEPYDPESSRIEQNLRREYQGDLATQQIYSVERSDPNYRSICPLALPIASGDRVEATINGVKTDGKSYLVKPEQLIILGKGEKRAIVLPPVREIAKGLKCL